MSQANDEALPWSAWFLAFSTAVVAKYFDLLPEGPYALFVLGVGTTLVLIMFQILYNIYLEDFASSKDKTEESNFDAAAKHGHAFALALLQLLYEQEVEWIPASVFKKVEEVVSSQLSTVVDKTSGANTAKLLLLLKFLKTQDAWPGFNEWKSEEKIDASVRAKALHFLQLVEEGPNNEHDKLLEREITKQFKCQIVVDHLTESIVLILQYLSQVPDYLDCVDSTFSAESNVNGLHTYAVIHELSSQILKCDDMFNKIAGYKHYKLAITGFGLAGSVAAWLSHLRNTEQKLKSLTISNIFCFAPVPVVFAQEPMQTHQGTYTFIAADDIASRFSKLRLEALRSYLKDVGKVLTPQNIVDEILKNDMNADRAQIIRETILQSSGVINKTEDHDKSFASSPMHVGQIYIVHESVTCELKDQKLLLQQPLLTREEGLIQHEISYYSKCLQCA